MNGIRAIAGKNFGRDANPMNRPAKKGVPLYRHPSASPNIHTAVNWPSDKTDGGQFRTNRAMTMICHHRSCRARAVPRKQAPIDSAQIWATSGQGSQAIGTSSKKAVGG
jgi:hypothetical protein